MLKGLLVGWGVGACVLGSAASATESAASANEVGLSTKTFVQAWTPLPTARFVEFYPTGRVRSVPGRAEPLSAARLSGLLEDAFASAGDAARRRGITLLEMAAPWDQETRTSLQRLRDAEVAYAGEDEARQERFVATLVRALGGVGRSVADTGASSSDLDKAYAAALSRRPGDARFAAEADQARWRTYADAFAAFVETQTPGAAAPVTAELQRQRVTDLAAPR